MNARWVGPLIGASIGIAVVFVLLLNLQSREAVEDPASPAAPQAAPKPSAHNPSEPAHHQGHVMAVAVADAAGRGSFKGSFMPMVAQDGPHYGATVQMPKEGNYRLIYTISPPDPAQFGRHTDPITGVEPWWDPFRVEFEFDYRGVPEAGSAEAKRMGVEVKPGFREYPIEPADGHTQSFLEVKAVWLPPIQMEGMRLPQDPNVIHLEADIVAALGNPNGFEAGTWIPYLRIQYELISTD